MKKIAVTVAVLALGLAGCNKTAADNTVNADDQRRECRGL